MVLYSKLQNTSKFLATISAIALFIVLASGCAQKKVLQPKVVPPATELSIRLMKVQSEGCRSCHNPEADVVAKVFSSIFDTPKLHHPVGVKYPSATVPNFAQPTGQHEGVAFFDRNGNDQPDDDEIMLFGATGEATVECASCHIEHGHVDNGGSSTTEKDPAKLYLRFANTGSAMCTTCHQY